MTTKGFVMKLVTKFITLLIISMGVFFILNHPIINNELALGQMENSNETYILMESYNQFKNIVWFIYACVCGLFAGTATYDTLKFIKTKNKGEE